MIHKNKIILLFISAFLVFGLSSCKHVYVTTLGTLKDIQGDLSRYEERLLLLNNQDVEQDETTDQGIRFSLTEKGVVYTQEELKKYLGTYNHPDLINFYNTELVNALGFIQTIQSVVEMNPDKKTSEEIIINDVSYIFDVLFDGSLLVHQIYENNHMIIKINIRSNKLNIDQIKYYYDETTFDPLSEERMEYNYYSYTEKDQITKLDMKQDSVSLIHASMRTSNYFIVEKQDITSDNELHSSYTVDYYNAAIKTLYQYEIYDEEILSETMNVYDENNLAYQYTDFDVNDDRVSLKINFLKAVGYEYIIVPTFYDLERVSEGIYTDDDTPLYIGPLSFTYDESNQVVKALLTFDLSKEEITSEVFDLSNLNLEMSSNVINYDSFQKIKIDSIDTLSDQLTIGAYSIFDSSIESASFKFVDADVRNIIKVFYNPTTEIEINDSILFKSDMANFIQNVYLTKSLRISEVSKVEDIDLESLTYIDLEKHYYYNTSNDVLNYEKKYLIQEIDNRLMEFTLSDKSINEYKMISFDDNELVYKEKLESLVNLENPLLGYQEIKKIDERTYEIKGSTAILEDMGRRLFEDKEYIYYDSATIIGMITFSEDYMSYSFDFEVVGLLDSDSLNTVSYSGNREYTIETFELYNPLEDESQKLPLAATFNDIIFISDLSDLYNLSLEEGESKWIKLDLQEGAYKVLEADVDKRLSYEVYDSDLDVISNQLNFYADIDGIYYIKFTSTVSQKILLKVVQDAFDKSNYETLSFENNTAMFNATALDERFYVIEPSEEGRIIKLSILGEDCNCFYEDMFTLKLNPSDKYDEDLIHFIADEAVGYFYLEPNIKYYIKASSLGGTMHFFNYEIVTLPSDVDEVVNDIYIDSIHQHPDVFLNSYQDVVRVHFTVSVRPLNTLMSLQTFFNVSHYDIRLFKEKGEELDFTSYLELPPGNYYFEYKIDEDGTTTIITTEFDDIN